jgi:integrase
LLYQLSYLSGNMVFPAYIVPIAIRGGPGMMMDDTSLTPAKAILVTESNGLRHAKGGNVDNSSRTAVARKSRRNAAETFPLFQRSDGRWAKKIRGRQRYFGYEKEKALEQYQREIGLLSQGLEPAADDIGLRELFNRYLTAKQRGLAAGEIGARALSDSSTTLRRVLAILSDRLVSTLVSENFSTLKHRLSAGRSIITVAGDIRRFKAAMNWAHREGLIARLPRFGDDFKPAPARAVRLAKSQRAALVFQPEELRNLLGKAGPQLKAETLLGANCALLPIDIARLTFDEIDADFTWLRQARGKTGVAREAALWPETATALKAAIAARPRPAKPEDAALVFLTEAGNPVVRTRTPAKAAHDPKAKLSVTIINRVTSDFRDLQMEAGIYRKGRGFNALRHGFLTVAEAGKDFPAVARVMGHTIPGVSSHYREHIGPDRIKACCWIVREWLFPKKPKSK